MVEQQKYDVFLSHNSKDKQQVENIADYLKERSLETWFDKNRIYGGDVISREINTAICNSKSAAFFVGKYGLGKWQQAELETLETLQNNENKLKIIPVLLPDVDELPSDPEYIFLRKINYISLSSEHDVEALDHLAQSILRCMVIGTEEELEKLTKEKEQKKKEQQQINRELKRVEIDHQTNRQIDRRIQQLKIARQIQRVELQLGTELDPQRRDVLCWLSSVKKVSRKYGGKSLKKFPELEALVKQRNGGFEEFCADLETCMEFVYFAFRTRNYTFLNEIDIDFSLTYLDLYQENACIDVYQETFNLIIQMIPVESLNEETAQNLKSYLEYLNKQLTVLI